MTTLRTVPYRIMRPTLHTLMASTLLVFTQAHGDTWTDEKLAAKILLLRDKTRALENPTRHDMQTHMTAWYGVATELTEAVAGAYPELSALLRNVLKEAAWLEPAWLYMQEQMEQWQKS